MRCLMFLLCSLNFSRSFLKGLPKLNGNLLQRFRLFATDPEIRNEDFNQMKDLDLILSERAKRFNLGPTAIAKEQCILLTVESRSQNLRSQANVSSENEYFSFEESLNELSELVGTAGRYCIYVYSCVCYAD